MYFTLWNRYKKKRVCVYASERISIVIKQLVKLVVLLQETINTKLLLNNLNVDRNRKSALVTFKTKRFSLLVLLYFKESLRVQQQGFKVFITFYSLHSYHEGMAKIK